MMAEGYVPADTSAMEKSRFAVPLLTKSFTRLFSCVTRDVHFLTQNISIYRDTVFGRGVGSPMSTAKLMDEGLMVKPKG